MHLGSCESFRRAWTCLPGQRILPIHSKIAITVHYAQLDAGKPSCEDDCPGARHGLARGKGHLVLLLARCSVCIVCLPSQREKAMPTITTKDGTEIFTRTGAPGSPSCSATAGRCRRCLGRPDAVPGLPGLSLYRP